MLCDRHEGIGADGIIFLEQNESDPFIMRLFQPDGLEVEMCGNGMRCLAHYIHSEYGTANPFDIKTHKTLVSVKVMSKEVAIAMESAQEEKYNQTLLVDNKPVSLHSLNTGVPHAVVFVEDLENEELMPLAKQIRHHAAFAPQGTNVNFVKITSASTLAIRSFERGVEGETQACGTGAVAAALSAAKIHGMKGPVTVIPRSKKKLTINFPNPEATLTYVTAQGPVRKTFTGVYTLKVPK